VQDDGEEEEGEEEQLGVKVGELRALPDAVPSCVGEDGAGCCACACGGEERGGGGGGRGGGGTGEVRETCSYPSLASPGFDTRRGTPGEELGTRT
jgi:hypothetical protein